MALYHLAQVNIGRVKGPIDDPVTAIRRGGRRRRDCPAGN